MAQVFNVLFTQSAGHTGHIAGIIGAVFSFEILEGFDHVIVILPGHFRNFILPFEFTQMAHRTQGFIGLG